MMAMLLHDNYTSRFGFTNTSAAAEVAKLLGFNKKTITLWKKDFLANRGEFSEYQQGSYACYTILMDEEYRDTASEWVRANFFMKGSPNLTASHFRTWVNSLYSPSNRCAASPSNQATYICSHGSTLASCPWFPPLIITQRGVY